MDSILCTAQDHTTYKLPVEMLGAACNAGPHTDIPRGTQIAITTNTFGLWPKFVRYESGGTEHVRIADTGEQLIPISLNRWKPIMQKAIRFTNAVQQLSPQLQAVCAGNSWTTRCDAKISEIYTSGDAKPEKVQEEDDRSP